MLRRSYGHRLRGLRRTEVHIVEWWCPANGQRVRYTMGEGPHVVAVASAGALNLLDAERHELRARADKP